MRGVRRAVAGLAVAGLLWAAPAAGAEETRWRVKDGDVRVLVPLEPGGAFEAKTTSLSGVLGVAGGTPLTVTGELASELAGLDTGIALRNRHLRENYLEVAKGPGYDKAVLSELRLLAAAGAAFEGRTPFKAVLQLHGMKSMVEGTADVRRLGGDVRVEATFPLTLGDFGIAAPRYMGVGVGSRLIVKVVLTASRAAADAR